MFNRLVTLVLAALFLGLLFAGGILTTLSSKGLDALFLLRGAREPSQDIIIIGIDDATLAELGPWPFSRRYHAQLLARLKQARVIGFDLLFSEPGPDDARFNEAIAHGPPVVFAALRTTEARVLAPGPTLDNGFGAGHIAILLGQDGVVRRAVLEEQSGKETLPSLALVMARAAGIAPPLPRQAPLLINYYGPNHTFLFLSYLDVLHNTIPADFFRNRFVLIGAEALGIGDTHVTPFTHHYQTPGVEIQATILNNLLDGSWLRPLPLFSWGALFPVAILGLLLWPASTERINLTANLGLTITLLLLARFLFARNLFFDPVPAACFLFLAYINHLVVERIWTARRIYTEMRRLDRQLSRILDQVYTNIPSQVCTPTPIPGTRGIRQHLAHLRAGISALGLQHQFIENILSRDLPPLILWEQATGKVILANAMFHDFWQASHPSEDNLPELETFFALLRKWRLQAGGTEPSCPTGTGAFAPRSLDIGLSLQDSEHFFQVNLHPVQPDEEDNPASGFQGILALLTDVTEIKKLEQLKDEVVSIVSHELKLPLTVILGYGEMLTVSLVGEEKMYAEKICEQSRRLNRLIEDFLDVTRLEHGRRDLQLLPLKLTGLIDEAAGLVAEPAAGKEIRIHTELPRRVTPILADATLLRQALTNLLDNAIKFSPRRSAVTVTLTEEPEQMMIAVADQGPGIAADQREAIFEKFNRGKQAPGQEGFGLGLSFVHQVIQRHGGAIRVEPAPQGGAVFVLTLPKRLPDGRTEDRKQEL